MNGSAQNRLHDLARRYRVQTVYYNASGKLVEPPAEAILAVLRMLGARVERFEDAAEAFEACRRSSWQRGLEPVIVAWDGLPPQFKLRVPSALAGAPVRYRLETESGEVLEGDCSERQRPGRTVSFDNASFVSRGLSLPAAVPPGYHVLRLETGARRFEALLLASYTQAYTSSDPPARRWGLFCPVYALTSDRSWGAGDFTDLSVFADFIGVRGGDVAATLPLLPAFLDEPYNPSPYAPVSRLFWNEFYLDVNRLAETIGNSSVQDLAASDAFQRELASVRAAPLVDYRRIMALKRKALEAALDAFTKQPAENRAEFEAFVAREPRAADYAEFRAKTERERQPWQQWAQPSRDGSIRAGDFEERARLYHLFVQWQADAQMQEVSRRAAGGGPSLYLDFPLGVNRDGYDVWRERNAFALSASGGAPPDQFFTAGQNWGFPPLHPEHLREDRYRYYIDSVRHHLRYARMLRIDHVMGLHRLYWIPEGFEAKQGVYVHYRAEELYAILSLESHRARAEIVGENLGTVPPYVNSAMTRHRIFGMHVSQFFVSADPSNALPAVEPLNVASLNTHDTPTFAGFWNESDIQDQLELGLVSDSEAGELRQERQRRRDALISFLRSKGAALDSPSDPGAVLAAWLKYLAQTDAAVLLLNLEDLWLEAAPQNVPGTWEERPNWQRKIRHPLASVPVMEPAAEILKAVGSMRPR